MTYAARALALVGLVACAQESEPGTKDDKPRPDPPALSTGTTTTQPDPACAEVVQVTSPADGDGVVFYRDPIVWVFEPNPAETDRLVLTLDGVPVAGSSDVSGPRINFVPDELLVPETTYEVALEGCPASTISWTTSSTGLPVDLAGLEGTAYALDITSGKWIEPAGAGGLIDAYVSLDVLTGVLAADPTSLTLLGAVAAPGTLDQDLCEPTVDFPVADFSDNPWFEAGPVDVYVEVLGASLTIFDFTVEGAFRPDFGGIEGVNMTGSMDSRGLIPVFLPGLPFVPDDTMCLLWAGFGVVCGPCPDGSGDYCVDAVIEDLAAPSSPGPLIRKEVADIAADPLCP